MSNLEKPARTLEELETAAALLRDAAEGFVAILAEIKERKLYKVGGYSSFEVYCAERWNLSQRSVWRKLAVGRKALEGGKNSATVADIRDEGEREDTKAEPSPPVVDATAREVSEEPVDTPASRTSDAVAPASEVPNKGPEEGVSDGSGTSPRAAGATAPRGTQPLAPPDQPLIPASVVLRFMDVVHYLEKLERRDRLGLIVKFRRQLDELERDTKGFSEGQYTRPAGTNGAKPLERTTVEPMFKGQKGKR